MKYVTLRDIAVSTLDPLAWVEAPSSIAVWVPLRQLPDEDQKTNLFLYLEIHCRYDYEFFESYLLKASEEELTEKIKLEYAGYRARVLKLDNVKTEKDGTIIGYEDCKEEDFFLNKRRNS